MPRQVSQNEIEVILRAVARFPEGGSVEDIRGALSIALPRRTLQRRLAMLVEQQRLIVEGRTRGSRYRLPIITGEAHISEASDSIEAYGEVYIPITPEGENVKQAVRKPVQHRHPVSYKRSVSNRSSTRRRRLPIPLSRRSSPWCTCHICSRSRM